MAGADNEGSGLNDKTGPPIFIVLQVDLSLRLRTKLPIRLFTAAEAEGAWFVTRSEGPHIFSTGRECSGNPGFD